MWELEPLLLPLSRWQGVRPTCVAGKAMEFSDDDLPTPPPPLQMPFGGSTVGGPLSMIVLEHPAGEVRTRTPGDKRCFGAVVRVHGWREQGAAAVRASLFFAPDRVHPEYAEAPAELLGGTLQCTPNAEGLCIFSQLWLWEPSSKHGEREFALRFEALDATGAALHDGTASVMSNAFYAFSHARVLKRRRDVLLRALNKTSGCSMDGGERLFVVGRGFLDSPSLSGEGSFPSCPRSHSQGLSSDHQDAWGRDTRQPSGVLERVRHFFQSASVASPVPARRSSRGPSVCGGTAARLQ